MAKFITKRPIGVEDISFDSNGSSETFKFLGSDGALHSASKINATHIPITKSLRNVIPATTVEEALTLLLEQTKNDNSATEAVAGMLKIATTAETVAGISNDTAITPRKLAGLIASTTLSGLVKLATSSDIANGTNQDSVIPVSLAGTLSGIPSGMGPFPWYFSNTPIGYLKADGTEYSRTLYANLWNAVKNEAVTETDWQNSEKSCFTFFSQGNGATTFRMPDLRGLFMRGADCGKGMDTEASARTGGGVPGSFQPDGAPNIMGSLTQIMGRGGSVSNTGAFTHSEQSQMDTNGSGGGFGFNTINFDAGTCNSIYGKSAQIRPRNFAVYWLFKI